MIFSISALVLISCGFNDIGKDVEMEIKREIPKDDTDNLGIVHITKQDKGEMLKVPSNGFKGYVYVVSDKERIESVKNSRFSVNNRTFEDVKTESYDDFNIRYHNKTYFSVKKIDIESNNNELLKFNSNYSKGVLLVYRTMK